MNASLYAQDRHLRKVSVLFRSNVFYGDVYVLSAAHLQKFTKL